jgi:hypothetical protein
MPRKSWADYKREQRKRERDRRTKIRDMSAPDLRTPFSDFFRGRADELKWHAGVLGDHWFQFEDDSGLVPDNRYALDEQDRLAAGNSLGKAELVIGVLIDAASEIADAVSAYKQHEIEARLREVEAITPRDLDEIERLKKMRHQLKKQVRWAFQQWKASG